MKKFLPILSALLLTLTVILQAQIRPGYNLSKDFSKDSKPSKTLSNAYLERVSSYPYGPAISIEVDSLRHLIFVSSGGAALILNGSDPANLQLLTDTLRTEGLVGDLAYDYATQRLYFACGYGGFEIWNVQDPYHPFRYSNLNVTYFDVTVPVRHVQIRNNIAVVECYYGGVRTINVTDPYNPFQVGFSLAMGNPAQQISVEPTDYVHTTGQNGYYRFYMDADGNLFDAGSRYFLYGAYAVFGNPDLAFVDYGDLYILDLHNPVFLPWSVTDVGGISHMELRGNLLYITSSNGLSIWNVSSPSNPFLVSTIPLRYTSTDFVIAGDYLYAAERDKGFDIVNIHDPGNPFIAGNYESFSNTNDVYVNGNYAYLSHYDDGVLITDISNLEYPVLVGQYDTPGTVYNATKVQNNIMYVADWDGGFRIADVSNPSNPVELSNVQGFNAWRVEAAGNYAYVVEGIPNVPDNLRIFDVSDPSSPVQISTLSIPTETSGIVYKDNHLYLASNDAGFQIVDVSDPGNPAIVSQLSFPTYVTDVYVRGNYAYVTSLGIGSPPSGLHIVDISDPENPVEIGSYSDISLEPFDIEVSGDYAYVEDDDYIAAFLISDPSNPVYLESIRTPDPYFGQFVIDSLIFVADQEAGLQIYKNIQYSQPGGGLNWHIQLDETTEGFLSICFTDLNNGWAAGYSGKLYRTTNGGNIWFSQSSGTGVDIYSIFFSSSQKGWFVGSSGKIFNTVDGGNSWQPQSSGTSNELYGISFVDDMNGWVVGDDIILHTTNGGNNWVSQAFPPGYLNGFTSVDFVDLSHGWIANDGEFGNILRTTNGGNNWTFITGLSGYSLHAVDFVNQNIGYFVGMFGAIIKTTDGGNTWITQADPPPHDWLYGVQFLDEQKGWAVGFNGKVIYTTNGGNYWLQQTSGTTAQLNSVYFIDQAHGWAAGEEENGGIIINYSLEITPVELTSFTATADCNSVTLLWQTSTEKNNSGFKIQRRRSGDNNSQTIWKKIGFVEGHGTSTQQNIYSFIDENLLAGNYSYKLIQIDFDGTRNESNEVNVEVNTLPTSYALMQNYPNPFNPSTTIEYSTPVEGNVTIIVFNSLGQKVKTLVNTYRQAGSYKVNFEASSFSSGIYYYKIESKNFTAVKKMILLK